MASNSLKRGLSKEETLILRKKHVASNIEIFFKSDPLKIVRGEGVFLYDDQGNQILDCINNVAHVGHCHPKVVSAAADQMKELNTNSRFLHDNMSLYAQKLASTFPGDLNICNFTNTGSEANDQALLMARHITGRKDVLVIDQAYHGNISSLVELSTYKTPNIPDYVHVAPIADPVRGKHANLTLEEQGKLYAKETIDKLKKKCPNGVAAFIVESIPVCGGFIEHPPGFLKLLFDFVRSQGGICISDEVQTGFGRCGHGMWEFTRHGVLPDIVTVGKAMGNGHPVAAFVTSERIIDRYVANQPSCYFNTYGGNPVSMAVGLAILHVIEDEKLLENVEVVSEYLVKRLLDLKSKHWTISHIQGRGLCIGVDLLAKKGTTIPGSKVAQHVLASMKARFILINSDGKYRNVLKIKPPICFSRGNVDRLCGALDEVLTDAERRLESNQALLDEDPARKMSAW